MPRKKAVPMVTFEGIERLLEGGPLDDATRALLQRWRRQLQPRYPDYPEPGYFRLRLVRHGAWVPAIIWRPCPLVLPDEGEGAPDPDDWCRPTERSRPLRAQIHGQRRPADPYLVWLWGRTIGLPEYLYRIDLGGWAREWAPRSPEARPRAKADLTQEPSIF